MAVLRYRFPGESPVQKTGAFKKYPKQNLRSIKGFVIGSFDNSEIFAFDETHEETLLKPVEPICLSKESYIQVANSYIQDMRDGAYEKIILSRVQRESITKPAEELFNELCLAFPSAFVYLIESQTLGVWIGASPEILLEAKSGKAKMISLAGTKKANDDSEWGEKERVEQEIVTQYLREEIAKKRPAFVEESPVFDRIAGPVKHLCSELNFGLSINPMEFMLAVHPTPAVCGRPRELVLKKIEQSEPHQRRFYAGMIGIVSEKETQVYVNLRCAQIIDGHIYLYVGGGLTKDSNAADEWNETINKAETIRQFL